MNSHIKTRKTGLTYSIRAAGFVLGESSNTVELSEGHLPPVLYFPRSDIGMACLEKSATTSLCPHKGDASYFTIHTKNGTIEDAAWSYETPNAGLEIIAGLLAFYPDRVTVEKL